MVFPATGWAERDGLSFTDDGAVQWSPRVVQGHENCFSGLGFWTRLAKRFGWEAFFPWEKANGQVDQAAFYEWALKQCPETADVTLDQLQGGGAPVFWRKPQSPVGKIVALQAPKALAEKAKTEDAASFPLTYQATRTAVRGSDASGWWPWAHELEPGDSVQIHPSLAEAMAIENGETIIVSSAQESLEGPACINRMVPPQLVWSCRRMKADRVLIQRIGQSREDARDLLKAIKL
jgi:anaerobic selenocysteine-containing dehydrogenase